MEIVWEGGDHPEFNKRVEKEVGELLSDGLGRTDDLIFHLITLSDDLEDGPIIEVHGSGGKVHATYIAKPKWVTLDQMHRLNN